MRKSMNHVVCMRRRHSTIFKNYEDNSAIYLNMVGFVGQVWSSVSHGDFCFLASSRPNGKDWREHVIRVGNLAGDVSTVFSRHSRRDYNLYFCPNAFSRQFRRKEFALPTRFGWCDMDDSDPCSYEPAPSLVWETSPGRYQGLWLWDKLHDPRDAEAFSRALADRHGGDSGWSITKMLRVPGSINHKPHYDEPFVKLVRDDWRRIPKRPRVVKRRGPIFKSLVDVNPLSHSAENVISRYRRYLQLEVRDLLAHDRVRAVDRSACIYRIIAALHGAGADADEIASVLWRSPYFLEKHGRDMGKLMAEVSRVIGKLGGGK